MSGFRLRRQKWSVALAILLTLVTATAVFAIYVGAVTSQWSNALPSSGTCLSYDGGYADLARVKWGQPEGYGSCPGTGMDENKSGYSFDGVTPGEITSSTNFLLGAFTHHNNPIYSGTSITQVGWAVKVPVCGQNKVFDGFIFYHDETTNWPDCGAFCDCSASNYDDYDYCEYGPGDEGWPGGSRCPGWPGDTGPNRNGCADRVTLPYTPPNTTVSCDGVNYTLALSQFIPTSTTCPATPSGAGSHYFYTVEDNPVNTACLYAQLTTPSAVSLASFTAAAQGSAIVVNWETSSELSNAGFNLYRDTSPGGLGVKLNESLIPSQGPDSPTGFAYSFTDTANLASGTTYYYFLEDVNLSGGGTVHEPASVTYTAPTAVTLSNLGAAAALPAAAPLAAAGLAALGGALWALRRRQSR